MYIYIILLIIIKPIIVIFHSKSVFLVDKN